MQSRWRGLPTSTSSILLRHSATAAAIGASSHAMAAPHWEMRWKSKHKSIGSVSAGHAIAEE
eukprot:389780-Rhodomonas_salina.1